MAANHVRPGIRRRRSGVCLQAQLDAKGVHEEQLRQAINRQMLQMRDVVLSKEQDIKAPHSAPTAPVLFCLWYRLQRQTWARRGVGMQEARELAQKLQSEVDRLQADEAEDRL